jgi:mRNA-binding protein PUF3
MSSATTNRPAGAVSLARVQHSLTWLANYSTQARTTRFGDFNAAAGRHNNDERSGQTSSLGPTFGNGGTWQPSSGIWGSNHIGSGFGNTKRDQSRSRGTFGQGRGTEDVTNSNTAAGNDDFPEPPSGSAALATSSEADPWGARANGPWNQPDTTSPTLQSSHSGSTSPSHVRSSIPNGASQTLLEIHNYPQQPRPAIGQGTSFGLSQSKSSLDPSSGSFKFVRKPSFGFNDDKENSGHHSSNPDNVYDVDASKLVADASFDITSRSFRDQLGSHNTGFLGIGSSGSRDGSMPPSRASDSGLSANGLAFANSGPSFGSIGHTPNSSIHSQRPSFSGSYPSQTNGSRYTDMSESELREKFSAFGFGGDGEPGNASQISNGPSYSPSHPNYAQHSSGYQLNGGLAMWNDASNGTKGYNNYENFSNQPFADQAYFNKGGRFERSSVSPAGSDYRRGLHSPKYYSAAGTPPSEQIYRPGSRGPRMPQGPSELDRRLQHVQYAQQQSYFQHFQGHYPTHGTYDYPAHHFRQNSTPYGYVPVPVYPSAQVVPTRPAKDQDVGVGVRSVLLEEFRSNSKSNKRYELKACIDV